MEATGRKKEWCGNIVPLPMLAHGHILTVESNPVNILHLRTLFPSNPSVRFAQLPFCSSDHGLPPDAKNTLTLSHADISRLFLATQSLQPAFHRLISDLHSSSDGPPLLSIVSDMFLSWSVDVARAFGLHHAVLYTFGPYAMSIYYSIWLRLPHAQTSADEIPVPDLPGVTVHRSQLSALMKAAGADGPDHPSAAFVRRQYECCRRSDAALWNTAAALEGKSLREWERSTVQPAWPVGPLHLTGNRLGAEGAFSGVSAPVCAAWLDRRPIRSVVYVSFGSQCSIGRAQMAELARGLEASGRPFVWTIRPPLGCDFGAAEEEWDLELPEGFEERMREEERGLLIRMWAPQLEILGHPATGAFLSHCGWNSVMESTASGVPVIAWPLAAEQFYNAKLLIEEAGVGMEIAR